MKYTLQELAAAVGCAFYPQRWNDFFEEVMTAYDAGGCRYSDPDYYERLEKEYGCFGEKYWPVYRSAAEKTAAKEPLDRFLALMARAVQDVDKKDEDIRATALLQAPDGEEPFVYNMFTGLVACSQLDTAAETMRRRGIPEDIIRDTLTQVIGCGSSYERRHEGAYGYDLLWWAQLHIDGKLYRIGRLQLELLETLPFPVLVLKHKDGTIAALADGERVHRDGYVLGSLYYEDTDGAWDAHVEETQDAWFGYAYLENGYIAKERSCYKKAEWEKVLAAGDPVVSVHIPAGGGLTPALVDETLVQFREFLEKYYPDYDYKAFVCASWLMDPQLDTLLPEDSNIVRFSRRFKRMARKSLGDGVFNFVFSKPDMNFDIRELPETTRLERALKQHYLSGKAVYEMNGFILR